MWLSMHAYVSMVGKVNAKYRRKPAILKYILKIEQSCSEKFVCLGAIIVMVSS